MIIKITPVAIFLATLVSSIDVQAGGNDPVPSPVMVSKVTFSQGTTLVNDDGSAMGTPHWIDEKSNANPNETPPFPDGAPDLDTLKSKPNNVKSYAYSYVSNKKPMVSAVFMWKNSNPPPEGSPYSAMGEVDGTTNCKFKLPKKELGGNTTYPATVTAENIVEIRKIQGYVTPNRKVERSDGNKKDLAASLGPVKIKWTVFNKQGMVVGVSYSTHTIYVTWDEPATTFRQETLFNLACETSDGMVVDVADQGKSVLEKIWSEFTDRKVRRMDNTTMTYWGAYSFANRNTQDASFYHLPSLLSNADGVCQTWQELLYYTTKVQSISTTKRVKISIDKTRKYNVNGVQKSHSFQKVDPIFILNHRVYVDFHTVPNIGKKLPGQGNPNPPIDNFVDHAFIRFLDQVYDPSYGTSHEDYKKWENDNLCAFCIVEDTTPDDPNDNAIENWWLPNDSNVEDLKYEDM